MMPTNDKPGKLPRVAPAEFFERVCAAVDGGQSCAVTLNADGKPSDHAWAPSGPAAYEALERRTKGRRGAYFSPAAFVGDLGRWHGRSAKNVAALRAFWVDVEGSADKHARDPGAGYPDQKGALAACKAFMSAAKLPANFVVLTGSGGVHLWWVLDEAVTVEAWLPVARGLVALANTHGFIIDAQVTSDPARIMRSPGSLHQSNGVEVRAMALKAGTYSLTEFAQAVGVGSLVGGEAAAPSAGTTGQQGRKYDLSVNGDVIGTFPQYSYRQAAQVCGAMRQAAQAGGAAVSYPVWLLALSAAAKSVEGPALAHEISAGHSRYDAAEVDRKIASLTGGPPGCGAWMDAYGPGGPCASCPRGGAGAGAGGAYA